MNTSAKTTTVRELIPSTVRRGNLTAQSAYDLALLSRRSLRWESFLDCPVRVPSRSMVECVRADIDHAIDYGHPVPSAVSLMRDGIADGLSNPAPGKGSRARRRIGALNMGARRKCRMPAAPVSEMHLNCA